MERRKTLRSPSRTQLLQQRALLESLNDQLQTEITTVDALLRAVGFDDGLVTLKTAAVDCLADLDG